MKLTSILLFIAAMQISATGLSQETKLKLSFDCTTLADLIEAIEAQSEFRIFYKTDQVDVQEKISVNEKDGTIASALAQALEGSDISYRIMDNVIVLTNFTIEQQQQIVRGTITDGTTGEPMAGVTIQVQGTLTGAISLTDGTYSVNVPQGSNTLIFSFVGYQAQEIDIASRTIINVVMEEAITALDEIVVIGYGTVRKSDLTGAVSSVRAEELSRTSIQAIDQGLVGKASGVVVTQTSGTPGAIASIRVRGTSSLEGGNEPLYVIDGFPMYAGDGISSAAGGGDNISALSTINPNDIERIEILKDASATAIYGARAANGVVLITTKSGTAGTDNISFNASYGIQNVVKKINVMNAYDYATLVNEAYVNDGYDPIYDAAKMTELQANPKGTYWQDEVFRSAPVENYQLTFSGGDNRGTYAISANYFNQDGIIINSNFKRFSGRINLDRNISNSLTVGTHFTATKTINNAVRTSAGGNSSVVTAAVMFNPVQPVYENEELKEYTQVNQPGVLLPNPVATAKEIVNKTNINRILGDIYGELKFLNNFKAKASFGLDLMDNKFDTYTPSYIYQAGGIASGSVSNTQSTTWLSENTISYLNDINEHSISGVVGLTLQGNHTERASASAEGFVNDVLQQNDLGSAETYNAPSTNVNEWTILSVLGRINYTFRQKYLFSVNGRMDGSSRFGENNKYAFFPSASFAWRASEEPFIRNLGFLSNLKFRLAYGYTGNQEIGLYNSLSTLSSHSYTIGGQLVTGFSPNKIPNPDLKWEKTSQFDIGVDIGFISNRFRITADYYKKVTTNIIYSTAIPYVSGFSTSLQNIGSMQNTGVELTLESDNISMGDFRWSTNLNLAINRNKVIELGGEEYKDVGSGDGHLKTGSIHRLVLDEPIGIFYGYVEDGIFKNQAEVDAGPVGPTNWVGGRRYKDLSGPDGVPDGVIDATNDRQIIGDPNPKFTGGMTNTFRYKGLGLSVFMQWSYGNKLFNYNNIELTLPNGGQNGYEELVDERFTLTNTDSKYTVATTNRSNNFSDFFMEDGSYLKIKTITLSYDLFMPRNPIIENFQLYCTLQNFITFTKYSGFDPEVSYRGATNLEMGEDLGTYPQAKTITFGIRLDM